MKAILFAFYLISGMNFVTLQSRKVTRTGVGLREHDGGALCLQRSFNGDVLVLTASDIGQ
jgi:hypothetical protein